ncbi:MAG: AEC family transporter [Hyphomicrobiaceae bacterium]|nr:AEC family transporter [Hyphomicrobiaceae bacterium]
MLQAINALVPVLLIMGLGRALASFRIISEEQWRGIDTLSYQVLFPALIVLNLASVDFAALPTYDLGATLLLTVLAMTALLLILRPLMMGPLKIDGPAFTSIVQGSTRWMTSVALVLCAGLYGPEGVALVSVAMVAMIPVLNLINVTILALYAGGTFPGPLKFLKDLATNPLIASCAIGLALNLVGLPLPDFLTSALRTTGAAALAIGLLAVGAGIDLSRLRRPGLRLTIAAVLRLAGMPLMAAGFAALFGLEGTALGVAIVCTAVPTASAAYLLARKMGGDAPLMAEIIALQTVAAIFTFPLALGLLAPAG